MKRLTVIIVLVILLAGCANTGGADPPEAVTAMPNITETPPRTPALTLPPTGQIRWSESDEDIRQLDNLPAPVLGIAPSPDGQYAVLKMGTGTAELTYWHISLLIDQDAGAVQWLNTGAYVDQSTFEWLPNGGLLWLDAAGELWRWNGQTSEPLEAPVPMGELWLTVANTAIVDPCEWDAGLYRVDLDTEQWEEVTAESGAEDIIRGYHQMLSTNRRYMLLMNFEGSVDEPTRLRLWHIPAEMGAPARLTIGPQMEIYGSDAHRVPGSQIGETPYWHHNLHIIDAPPLIDERDGSLHAPGEVGVPALPTRFTVPVEVGQEVLAQLSDGALIRSEAGEVARLNDSHDVVRRLYLFNYPPYGDVSAVKETDDAILLGVTAGDACPCGLIEWKPGDEQQ